jgi:hypothetical protein
VPPQAARPKARARGEGDHLIVDQAGAGARRRDPAREPARLDEDGLAELLGRVRRERDKAVQLYRREVGAQVSAEGARGAVGVAPRRSASKAEIFEQAPSRVSAALAKAARRSAADLRAERLAAARRPRAGGAAAKPRATKAATTGPAAPPSRPRKPVEKKTAAGTKAAGARRQAARDAR